MTYKRFIGTRIRQLVRQGLLPKDAMRRAAWEWRYGQNPRISPTEVEIEPYTYYKPSIGKRVTVPGYRKYLPIGGRNPGAAWHKSVVPEFDKLAAVSRAPSEKGFWSGMAQAHSASAETSERLGMPNPGAAWHRERMREGELAQDAAIRKREGRYNQGFWGGIKSAQRESAIESSQRGMPNPARRTNWLPVLAIAGLAALVWWLNRPKQTTT